MPERLKRLLVGISLSATLLSAGIAAAQEIEIATGSDNMKLVEALGAGFKAENPGVEIEVPVGPRSYDDLAQDLLRRATIGEPLPDLVVVGSNQRLFAERGLALPLDPILANYPDSPLHDATPVVLEKGRILEHTYGVAFGVSLPVVLFNLDLVEKAGGDPQNLPRDWDGILELAGKINELGSPVIGGFLEADMSGSMSLLFLLQSHGGAMMSQDESELTLDSPEALAALHVAERFGEIGQSGAAMSRDQARQAFGAGTVGVLVTMSSLIPRLEEAGKGRFEVAAIPFPLASENGVIPSAGPIASIMSKDPDKQGILVKFLEFVISPAGQLIVATESGYFPTNQPAIEASEELQQVLANRSNADAIIERLPDARGWFTPPGSQAARIATITADTLLEIVALKTTPEDAATEMSKQIEPLLP